MVIYCDADYKPHAPSNILASKKDAFLEIVNFKKKKEKKYEGTQDEDEDAIMKS